MTKQTYRVLLSNGESCVLVALNKDFARGLVEHYLRDGEPDRGLSIVRIEEHRAGNGHAERLALSKEQRERPVRTCSSVSWGI